MTIRPRQLHVAERRGAEAVEIRPEPGHVHTAEVVVPRRPVAFARTDLRDGDVVKLLVAERGSGVTDRAFECEERLRPDQLAGAERFVVARKKPVPRRVIEREL